jgi:hypothetical protein
MGKKAILSPYSIKFFFLYKFFGNDFGSEIEDFFNLKRFFVCCFFLHHSLFTLAAKEKKMTDSSGCFLVTTSPF